MHSAARAGIVRTAHAIARSLAYRGRFPEAKADVCWSRLRNLSRGPADKNGFQCATSRIGDFVNVFEPGEWTRTTDLLITEPAVAGPDSLIW